MDPTSREDLSALMDDELGAEPARFLLRRMEHEPELAQVWSRWHLIRACLGGARDDAPADPVRRANAGSKDEDLFAARVLHPGVWIVMHGGVFDVDHTRKDRALARFVATT